MKIKITLLWLLLMMTNIGIYPALAQATAGTQVTGAPSPQGNAFSGISTWNTIAANPTQRVLIIPGAPNPAVNDMQQMNGDYQRILHEQQIDSNRISNKQPSSQIVPVPTGVDQKQIEDKQNREHRAFDKQTQSESKPLQDGQNYDKNPSQLGEGANKDK